MNVLQVRPRLSIGGATAYLLLLVEGFAQRGHKVVVASGGGVWEERLHPSAIYYPQVGLLPRINLGRVFTLPNVMDLFLSLSKLIRIIQSEEIEVINTHHRFASLVCRLASRETGVPLVSTMHEFLGDHKLLTRAGMGDKVVVLSSMVKRAVVETYKLKPDRVEVIPVGIPVPPPLKEAQKASLTKDLGLEAQAPIIVCIGRLIARKGQKYLLQAIPGVLKSHPQAQFLFVGVGDDQPALEALARELGITEQVRFLGTRDDVPNLIGLCDFTVLPSLQEEFGIVLLESFAQKKPVVATTVGGIPEIVQEEENGLLVPPRDSRALSEAINGLLGDRKRLKRLGENGYRLVLEQYSVEAFLDKTEDLYKSLSGRRQC
ncbi:MAG: glycosyltransferase family 4 protein [Chloroflexota bacterium]